MKILKKLKSLLSAHPKKIIAAAAVLAMAALHPSTQVNDLTSSSVMITNIAGNSGGTGIVISSSESHSEVLTNSHVCRVVEHGGLVSGRFGQFLVSTFRHSQMHDLCLIVVEGNLKVNTKVAERGPIPYSESASISGHPALMPNVITNGHFSGRKVIAVMKGIKPCTEEQAKDPRAAFLCALTGGLPDIVQYDAVLVTATIMPGSSGSGVYNQDKELSGVAFAGSGNIGYAWTVPFESMKNFLDSESKLLEPQRPDNSVDLLAANNSRRDTDEAVMMEKLKTACGTPDRSKIKETCDLIGRDVVWVN